MNMREADAKRVEKLLDEHLSGGSELKTAMRYAVLNGGKRVRAHLVYASSRLCGVSLDHADYGAMAIEMIHAYSLVHDDMPCMDNDDMRRGLPTVHVKWNEATAVLVGDALQALAFEALGNIGSAEIMSSLAKAARGMVEGQALDLAAENRFLSLDEITELQNRKTGDLIAWAAGFGASLSGDHKAPLEQYARAIGLAFQIQDDILDIEANSQTLGKTVGKDVAAGKATFVSHLGLDGAKARAKQEAERAKSALMNIDKAEDLIELADFVITRVN